MTSKTLRRLLPPALLFAAGALAVYRPILSGEALAGRDLYRLFIPDADFLLQCLRAGDLPLWLPFERLGHPFAATIQSQAFYPPRLFAVLLAGPVWGVTLEHLLHVAIAWAGAALASRRLGASRPAALLAGAAFALGPLFTQLNSVQNIVCSVAWSGFILVAAQSAARRPSAGAVARLAAVFALSFLAGSPEALLWQVLAAAALALASTPRRIPATLAVGAGGAWALAACAFVALPAAELAREATPLGPHDILAWSATPADLASHFLAGANWPLEISGDGQALVLTFFQGAWLSVFAAFALTGRARRRRLAPLALLALFLSLLALGRNFAPAEALLGIFPFSLFRYPAKYALGAAFLAAVLAGPGIDRAAALARRARLRTPRVLALAGAAFAACLVLALAAPALGLRAGAVPGALWLGTVLAAGLCVLGLMPGGAAARGRRARAAAMALVALEAAAVHAAIGPPFSLPASRLQAPSRLAGLIDGDDRLSTEAELDDVSQTPEGISLADWVAASRDALAGKRFVEERLPAIDGYESRRPARLDAAMREGARGLFDLAGVGWFLRRGPAPFSDLETVFDSADPSLPSLYRGRTALPRAFVVHRARAVDAGSALRAMLDPGQPFRHTAFVELSEGERLPALEECAGSEARVVEERANGLALEVRACGAGLLVVADSWARGWTAQVDGEPAPLWRADFLVRALPVPAGAHRVELRYAPKAFWYALPVSLAALAAMLAAALARRRRRNPVASRPPGN